MLVNLGVLYGYRPYGDRYRSSPGDRPVPYVVFHGSLVLSVSISHGHWIESALACTCVTLSLSYTHTRSSLPEAYRYLRSLVEDSPVRVLDGEGVVIGRGAPSIVAWLP